MKTGTITVSAASGKHKDMRAMLRACEAIVNYCENEGLLWESTYNGTKRETVMQIEIQ